jgi:hypothetical protein
VAVSSFRSQQLTRGEAVTLTLTLTPTPTQPSDHLIDVEVVAVPMMDLDVQQH